MKKYRAVVTALAVALQLPLVPLARAQISSLEDAIRRLEGDDVLVSDAAVEEVVAFGREGADVLLGYLDDERRDVRAGAIRGLGLLREPRAAEPIRGVLRGTLEREEPDTMADRYFRILSIQALGRIGDRASEPLLADVASRGDPFERAHAGISLFLLGAFPGYDLVRECLADTSMAIRNVTVEGLVSATDSRTLGLVLPMTDDESWVVRDSAYRALGSWRGDRKVREALEKGRNDVSWFVRETVREIQGGREG